jgi:hypothetical protein
MPHSMLRYVKRVYSSRRLTRAEVGGYGRNPCRGECGILRDDGRRNWSILSREETPCDGCRFTVPRSADKLACQRFSMLRTCQRAEPMDRRA